MIQKKHLVLTILGLIIISSMNSACSVIEIRAVNLEARDDTTYIRSTIDDEVIPPSILTVDGGRDIVTYVGQHTTFKGYVVCPYDTEIKYEWDFDNDGVYDSTGISYVGRSIRETFVYDTPGLFKAKLKVTLLDYEKISSVNSVIVNVKTGKGEQTFINEEEPLVVIKSTVVEGDGNRTNYAVLINGDESDDAFYFLNDIYGLLTYCYDYLPENVFVLDYDGNRDPDIVDYDASLDNVSYVFNLLSLTVDNDDFLGVWLFDHGSGYNGPQSKYYGYLSSNSFVSVDGDEDDYLESDFKLRSLTAPRFPWWKEAPHNTGLHQWKCEYYVFSGYHRCIRYKYESHFSNVFIEDLGSNISDDDIWIEKFTDYLAGDYNEDGWIMEGEVWDFDGDGIPPYDPETGEYDEDDWGYIDYLEDNFKEINTRVPPNNNYTIFDYGLDNLLDIDIDYDPDNLEIDGTDIDNQGLFDGLDINSDGDQNDMISIDEAVRLYNGEGLVDGFLNDLLSNIDAQVIMVVSNTCYSGGLHWDLSAPNRIIISSTIEEDYSWYKSNPLEEFTTFFADGIGIYRLGDSNNDGMVSIAEAFNYASEVDLFDEIPQYDDNGDQESHAYPIPNGSDGELGSNTFLGVLKWPPETPTITGPTNGEAGTEYSYTFVTIDNDGDNVSFFVDWGDNTNTGWTEYVASETMIRLNHTWSENGTYNIKAKAKDTYGFESEWSEPYPVRIGNQPPDAPTITGETNGEVGVEYEYNFTTTDPEGDNVYYWIEWFEDDPSAKWEGPYASGDEIIRNHTWYEKGTYTIRAKAKDVYGAESDWGYLEVTMPKNQPSSQRSQSSSSGQSSSQQSITTTPTSTTSQSSVNRQFWDAVFGENIAEIGRANQDSKEDNIWCINEKETRYVCYELTLFGDPAIDLLNHFQNNQPDKPDTPSGPTEGETGVEYSYTTYTTDPDGHPVQYGWDWEGDFIINEWTDFYPSGTPVTVSHSWLLPGPRWIRVKARDVFGAESEWSDPLQISLPVSSENNQAQSQQSSSQSSSQSGSTTQSTTGSTSESRLSTKN